MQGSPLEAKISGVQHGIDEGMHRQLLNLSSPFTVVGVYVQFVASRVRRLLVVGLALVLAFATGGTQLAHAATSADENLSFEVRLTGNENQRPPLGERATGYLDSKWATNLFSLMGSMTGTLLVDGRPIGPLQTAGGLPTRIGTSGSAQFSTIVTSPGTYSAQVTGNYEYYDEATSTWIRRSVNAFVPLFTAAAGKTPRATGVRKVTGPRTLAFTKENYRNYKYKVFVQDRDHALDTARIDDVFIPQGDWKRTKKGWVIPYTKRVAPASPYEFKRLPKVYKYSLSVVLEDDTLEDWQSSRADTVREYFRVTFRK
jgi:hypothetical protein